MSVEVVDEQDRLWFPKLSPPTELALRYIEAISDMWLVRPKMFDEGAWLQDELCEIAEYLSGIVGDDTREQVAITQICGLLDELYDRHQWEPQRMLWAR